MAANRFKSLLFLSLIVGSTAFAAIPSGYYYFAKNKKQAELKTALHIYAAPMAELEYGSGPGFTWEGFFYTDQNADGSVIDMYSNTVRKFSGFSSISDMHIEHSLPKSWWGAYNNNAYKDLFHLYPADAITNITKSNLPLGEVTGTPTLDNGVTKIGANGFGSVYFDNCFEPDNEFKGDFARSYFYISTIYQDFAPLWQSPMMNNNSYPVWKPWAIDLLLKWHRQDPVSTKELARIEAIYNIQGNRNPFIDYPDLAEYIWGKDTSNIFPFPNETEPFLLTPRRGISVDFGVILVNDSRAKSIHIQGVNTNTDIQFSFAKKDPSLTISSSSISAQNCLTGTDFSITFSPTIAGSVHDTLLVKGGGLAETLLIPIKALATADFITLEPTNVSPVGGNLNWISDPQATDYHLTVFQGEQHAGDLFISTYAEGSSWNKAIEIFNGTGKTVDLSNYTIKKQTDGTGDFGATIHLSGQLENYKSYVIANNKLTNTILQSKAQRLDSLISFNGNDAVALVRNGVTIDMVGPANAGVAVTWGADLTLQRKLKVTHPISTFNLSEWETFPIDSYDMLGNHSIVLTTGEPSIIQDVLTGKITSYPIKNLLANNTYTYKVEALRSDANRSAINTMQLHTTALDIPILMQASDIQATSFKANWEETLFASGYLINVFKVSGQADTTEIEGFFGVGTTGTPLPSGWTGNASGNYTSSTSIGLASPSMAFKNAGEWLQTKIYPQPVSSLKFMYRFATNIAGASFLIDGLSNGNWIRIDSVICKSNTKINAEYSLNAAPAINSFRFTFNKMPGGNFAIDDVQATYGSQDSIFILKNTPTTTNSIIVSNLTENSSYFYQVKATLGTASSLPSESIGVQTLLNNKLNESSTTAINFKANKEQISIVGLQGDEIIRVFSLTGICVYQTKAINSEMSIEFKQRGAFIIQIKNNKYATAFKFMNYNN